MTRPGVTYWTASPCDQVVRLGWSFLHHLIFHLKGGRHDNHYIRLNKEAREDIQWWLIFIGIWNGISIFPVSRPVVDLASMHQGPGDVEPTQTIGGFRWNGQPNLYKKDIAFKELLSIVLAVTAWGHQWCNHHIRFFCDNEAVVHVVASCYSKSADLMHFLHCLFFF